jgi:hypothetical protein
MCLIPFFDGVAPGVECVDLCVCNPIQNVQGAFIVFDASDPRSLARCDDWFENVEEHTHKATEVRVWLHLFYICVWPYVEFDCFWVIAVCDRFAR